MSVHNWDLVLSRLTSLYSIHVLTVYKTQAHYFPRKILFLYAHTKQKSYSLQKEGHTSCSPYVHDTTQQTRKFTCQKVWKGAVCLATTATMCDDKLAENDNKHPCVLFMSRGWCHRPPIRTRSRRAPGHVLTRLFVCTHIKGEVGAVPVIGGYMLHARVWMLVHVFLRGKSCPLTWSVIWFISFDSKLWKLSTWTPFCIDFCKLKVTS